MNRFEKIELLDGLRNNLLNMSNEIQCLILQIDRLSEEQLKEKFDEIEKRYAKKGIEIF